MTRRGKREGSIYQSRDGRWIAMLDLGFVNGKRRRKAYYGKTRAVVRTKLAGALVRQQQGVLVDTNDLLTTGAYLTRWLSTVSVRPKTRRQYEQVVRLYLIPALGPVRLAQLTPDQVRAMVKALEARGLSARTATLARDVLRIALSQAVSDQLITRNVAKLVRRPKPLRRHGLTLSAEDARALLDALTGHRLEAIITCGVALGLRLGEVLGLQWADLDVPGYRLAVRHALQTIGQRRELVDVKSRESHRAITLPAFVVRAFERQKARQAEQRLLAGSRWQRSDFVFTTGAGRPLQGTLVTRDLKRLLDKTWTGGTTTCQHARVRRLQNN